jgi:hypothetical protein
VTTSAGAARGTESPQFPIDVGERPRGLRIAQALEHAQGVQALAVAESTGTRGIVGDRLTHDVALGFAETRGRLPNLGDRRVVQRERDT